LPPFVGCLEIGEKDHFSFFQYLHGLAVETAVHSPGGKPYKIRDEQGGNQCRLLAFDNGNRLG